MKRFVVVIAIAALLATGALVGWRVGKESSSGAAGTLERIEARREQAEASARALVDALGRLCASFDFFFKHDMANGALRPVRCSLPGEQETALIAYGFDSAETQGAWTSEWGGLADQRGATLIEDAVWAVEVLDPDIVADVRSVVLGGR